MRGKKEKKGRILGYHDWEKIVLTRGIKIGNQEEWMQSGLAL